MFVPLNPSSLREEIWIPLADYNRSRKYNFWCLWFPAHHERERESTNSHHESTILKFLQARVSFQRPVVSTTTNFRLGEPIERVRIVCNVLEKRDPFLSYFKEVETSLSHSSHCTHTVTPMNSQNIKLDTHLLLLTIPLKSYTKKMIPLKSLNFMTIKKGVRMISWTQKFCIWVGLIQIFPSNGIAWLSCIIRDPLFQKNNPRHFLVQLHAFLGSPIIVELGQKL